MAWESSILRLLSLTFIWSLRSEDSVAGLEGIGGGWVSSESLSIRAMGYRTAEHSQVCKVTFVTSLKSVLTVNQEDSVHRTDGVLGDGSIFLLSLSSPLMALLVLSIF